MKKSVKRAYMRLPRIAKKLFAALGILFLAACGAYYYAIEPHHSSAPPESAAGLLDKADSLAWNNRWVDARPLYSRAEKLFIAQRDFSRALYAQVSQIPPDESLNIPATIWALTKDLAKNEAAAPETRLRILVIRGMLEIDYNASEARATWREVAALAVKLHHFELASRATGEQGIAAFILGDTTTAKSQVIKAWELSKLERDPAATVRYASIFGVGLVQLGRFKEALIPLNQAIDIAANNPTVAYPTIAIYAKIDALAGLHQFGEAMTIANASLARLQGTLYEGHKSRVYLSRGEIHEELGNSSEAIADYQKAIDISSNIGNYRGVTDAGGFLARAYQQNGNLPAALTAINQAIEANTRIPEELYLVPRNLAIKAEITAKMGKADLADGLYQKSITLVNGMIEHADTNNIQRQLLSEMSDVYSGYFALLCEQRRYDDALQALEQVRGRVETEALEHHANHAVHPPTTEEQELTRLNLSLINTDDPGARSSLISQIDNAELKISPSGLAQQTTVHPVHLSEVQRSLLPRQVLIEYVLAERGSYAFAITRTSVASYHLPSKRQIEADTSLYRGEIRSQKTDPILARHLFDELLNPIKEYREKTDLVIVPDSALHLLPFAALLDHGSYVIQSHTVDVEPSSTVFDLLAKRLSDKASADMPYVGVAAWTQPADTRNAILRAISGPERSQLAPLPSSKLEVETVATDLPKPNTILLGADATEGHFKHLSLDSTEVIHLALHGYADLDYPDRSALIFAPDPSGSEDGLLQVREIRKLHLNAKLVTLSACDTGVGPVGEAGVANLVNAFIEAGADSVVSTLWELEDHATEHLMVIFYSQLAQHVRKVDALRTAQLDLLNQGLGPYFWASFQIVGDAEGRL
jgi:CHAT domain-containing protein